ncbi:MAG: LamG-like jellyroll fold domain-containing protein [archaeon]
MKKRGILVFVIIYFVVLVYAGSFQDLIQSDFSGNYNNTFYNTSGFIQVGNNSLANITNDITEMSGSELGLVSYWRMNSSSWSGSSEEVIDVLGNNHGTARNGATTASGLFGNAGSFDGTNDYIDVGNSNSVRITQNITLSAWIKFNSIPTGTNGDSIICKNEGGGYGLLANEASDGKIQTYFHIGGSYKNVGVSLSGLSAGTWYYVVVTYNGSSVDFYLNGVRQQTVAASGSISDLPTVNLTIGANPAPTIATYTNFFDGLIDEAAVWNEALNSSEILRLYQKGNTSSQQESQPTTGTYESSIKDAGSIVNWTNISWNGLTQQENQGITTQQGNVLLMHLEGNANDENGINNGMLINSPTSVAGKSGFGYYLNGVNQYIEINDHNSLDLNSDFSIGLWVNFTSLPSTGQWQGLMAKGGAGDSPADLNHNFFLTLDNNMGWGAGIGTTWGYEDSAGANYQTRYQWTPVLGVWYHIVGVFNESANTMTLYINGSQVAQASDATAIPITNTHPVFIGRNLNGSTPVYYLNAVVDDAFIANKSLGASEIQSIYTNSNTVTSNVNLQLRISSDNSSWSDYSSFYNSASNLNLSSSRYVQYRAYFTEASAKLYNVSFFYDSLGELSVSLDSPEDNYLTNQYNNINITCSASSTSQLVNVTAYYDKFGWQEVEPARQISGTSNTSTFTLNEISSAIKWNCYFCSADGNCSFASNNRTIIGDIQAPTINIVSPEENHISSSLGADFIFNVSDNRATSLSCILIISNIEKASNSSVVSGLNTILSAILSNGNYSWQVNCSDGINSAISEARNISLASTYTPFWAKSNTHTHTTNSDGDSSPATVVSLYKNLGYSILAITDHGYVTNCTPFTNLSANFICVSSEEWTSTKHITRINVSSPYNNNIINMQNAVNAANSGGGFAIAAHPNWSSTIWSVSDLTSLQDYTAMEIYNKVIERLTPDPYAVKKWDEVLKTGKKIFGVAADDMHQVSVDLGYGWTKVYMPQFTKQDYINSMRIGYFYSSQGPSMDIGPFALVCDEDGGHHMGESVNCSSISVNATISATNSSYKIQNISLIKNGVAISTKTDCASEQDCSFSYSENVSASGYYRLEAVDSKNKQIWSNPIWVTKIALQTTITIHSLQNNSNTSDYTRLLNVSLNQEASLWYNLNGGNNITLCGSCSAYQEYLTLREGSNTINVFSNNSDNILVKNQLLIRLNFNKTLFENFSDNSSILSTSNIYWNNNKMSMNSTNMFGNFVFKDIISSNNITGFRVSWVENNTENAKGEGQRVPVILKYKFGDSAWQSTDPIGNYIVNGSSISGLNSKNLSLMIDIEKNDFTPVDLINFTIHWSEYTVPLITNVSASSVTLSSVIIRWNTDSPSNSSVYYGTTTSLGSEINSNNSLTSHSITLTGLSPSTGYFYKVQSCTESSCSRDPQESYPPYSFTTQSVSTGDDDDSGSSGVSSGGGGGGGAVPAISQEGGLKLLVSLVSEVTMRAGEKKAISANIKNMGGTFLNDCRLKISGETATWISSNSVESMAQGQEISFQFLISVPSDADEKKYNSYLKVDCKEGEKEVSFNINVIQSSFSIEINSLSEDKGRITIKYLLKENSGLDQDLEIKLWLTDPKGTKLTEGSDSVSLKAGEQIEREAIFEVPPNSIGEFIAHIQAVSGDNSNLVSESILVGSGGLTGRAILGGGNTTILSVIFIIGIGGFLAYFVLRKIMKNTAKQDRTGYVKLKLGKRKH